MNVHSMQLFTLLGLALFLGVMVAPSVNAMVFWNDELNEYITDLEHNLNTIESEKEAYLLCIKTINYFEQQGILSRKRPHCQPPLMWACSCR